MFTLGFRPFFLLAGIYAVMTLALSIALIQGDIRIPTTFDAVTWHHHEMLFGYTVAVIAGFLLTAVPNWTGTPALRGWSLFGMAALWLAGRVSVAFSESIGHLSAAIVDISFLVLLMLIVCRQIIVGKNWRNLQVIGVLFLLTGGNMASHGYQLGWFSDDRMALKLTLSAVSLLIALIGGRIIPAFTRNWLKARGERRLPAPPGSWFDHLTMALSLAALLCWSLEVTGIGLSVLLLSAGGCQLVRLTRWRGWATRSEPLLWSLHAAYMWLPAGLTLLALGSWSDAVSESGAIHAFTAGLIGTMTLTMMARVTLGHTGRPLRAGKGLTVAVSLISLAAMLRIFAAIVGAAYTPLLYASAASWIAAFALFLFICAPMLITARVDASTA